MTEPSEEDLDRSRPLTSVDLRTGDLTSLQITVTGTVTELTRAHVANAVTEQLVATLREMGVDAT